MMASAALPGFLVPGADFPEWAGSAAASVGLVSLVVVVVQAVRYFREHRDE